MYELKVKDTVYTCPDESIIPLAMVKAMNRNDNTIGNAILCKQGAIEYLKSIGIEVNELLQ